MKVDGILIGRLWKMLYYSLSSCVQCPLLVQKVFHSRSEQSSL